MTNRQILLFKQAALFIAACSVLLVYFNIDVYNRLYNAKLATFKEECTTEAANMSLQDRMYKRFGEAYRFSQYVKYYVSSPQVDNPLILLPPPEYLKAFHFPETFPEPVVYYYFTGCRCVTPESENVYDANYAIFLKNNIPYITRLKSKQDITEVLALYKARPSQGTKPFEP
jgi:hypothetical protein